ncbi:transmembrane protein 17A isoform X4 [Dunckerocampus dactyliophorus]|uniref:transmembrane protein 17A isoform X4 n=1 Tax=Dunckerocampus dactyliophorus TaxID=161453 RepID=UPI0024061644|nr:transmembrane protein 17A isoform X4 [Dunckerocampus dactyliophorus]
MPVFYSPVPENVRVGLAYVGTSVLTNNRTADSKDQEEHSVVNELVSHLPLQMLLYFNMFYFPCWWFSSVFMLQLKYEFLPAYYQGLLITGVVLLTLIEVLRLYLGYVGNLEEKLPVILFFLTDEEILILPLERAVHALYLTFLLAQILAAMLALRRMTRKLTLLFHLRQLGKADGFGRRSTPVYGLSYHRGVLPVSPAGAASH